MCEEQIVDLWRQVLGLANSRQEPDQESKLVFSL